MRLLDEPPFAFITLKGSFSGMTPLMNLLKFSFKLNLAEIRQLNMRLFNTLSPKVKLWVMQSFLTFDSMDRTLKCDHSLDSC